MAEETANAGVRAGGLSLADKLRLLLEITRKISRSLDLHNARRCSAERQAAAHS